MKKLIRDKIPFVLLFLNLVFVVLSYFEWYHESFIYLGNICGYSILTNLFMYNVYMNKKYCVPTKFAVLGLFLLNIFDIIYLAFNISGAIYDIFLILTIILVLTFLKIKK
jgi:hypothetical protein